MTYEMLCLLIGTIYTAKAMSNGMAAISGIIFMAFAVAFKVVA